jgi:hypothetical protein
MDMNNKIARTFGRMLDPADYAESGISNLMIIPSAFGEVGICLWLLIIGSRTPARVASGYPKGEL